MELQKLTLDELDALIADATAQREKLVDSRKAELLAELEKLGVKAPVSCKSGKRAICSRSALVGAFGIIVQVPFVVFRIAILFQRICGLQ